MKVTIRDRATLSSIRPERVESYLLSKGWERTASEADRYSLWVKDGEEAVEVLLPLDPRLGDFIGRMSELLEDLQRAEQRSQLEILHDIAPGNFDAFRFHSR